MKGGVREKGDSVPLIPAFVAVRLLAFGKGVNGYSPAYRERRGDAKKISPK
jgi:hypothetical protein